MGSDVRLSLLPFRLLHRVPDTAFFFPLPRLFSVGCCSSLKKGFWRREGVVLHLVFFSFRAFLPRKRKGGKRKPLPFFGVGLGPVEGGGGDCSTAGTTQRRSRNFFFFSSATFFLPGEIYENREAEGGEEKKKDGR